MTTSAPRLPYMPGLDGLRALAVSGVLLYHGAVTWMPGGFLGVDMFFVLSGYLITSLLLVERARAGRIDLKRFWLGRARRLLPAALLVIGVCLLIVAIFLPSQLGQARGDALSSIFYVNNWHQILADRSYFVAFGRPSLFQHLWSLAVEEQFYLLWPLILTFGLAKLGRGRMVIATVVMLVVSTGLMAILFNPHGDPSRVYYGTDTRAAVLLAGALLAFVWAPGRLNQRVGPGAGRVLDGLGVVGLALLVVAALGWHDYSPWLYRGGYLVVALATVLLIAATVHPAARIGRLLGWTPLRWIGKRSYGIYLWHWPVMTLSRPGVDVRIDHTVLLILQIAVTVGLAELSYRYVEMPIRRGEAWPSLKRRLGQWRPRQRLAVVAGAGLAFVLVVGFAFGRPVGHVAESRASTALSTAAARQPAGAAPAGSAAGPATPATASKGYKLDPPLFVGASVMLAAQPALAARWPKGRIDAAVGRQVLDVIARLEAYRNEGTLPNRVVVQVGENGPLWRSDADKLREVLRGVDEVVLMNVRVPRSWEPEVNDMLKEIKKGWRQATIADWYAASADPSLLFDQAHPDPAGQKVYADVVAAALKAGRPIS
jgi:peptidoglycan/LPS O-acetylase OafA/YrhL